jgi:hypothetical protein
LKEHKKNDWLVGSWVKSETFSSKYDEENYLSDSRMSLLNDYNYSDNKVIVGGKYYNLDTAFTNRISLGYYSGDYIKYIHYSYLDTFSTEAIVDDSLWTPVDPTEFRYEDSLTLDKIVQLALEKDKIRRFCIEMNKINKYFPVTKQVLVKESLKSK